MISSITLLSHFRRVRQRQPPASGLPLGLLPEIWIEMRSGFLALLHQLGPIFAIFGASDRDKSLDLKV
jgi:hypothetical protein